MCVVNARIHTIKEKSSIIVCHLFLWSHFHLYQRRPFVKLAPSSLYLPILGNHKKKGVASRFHLLPYIVICWCILGLIISTVWQFVTDKHHYWLRTGALYIWLFTESNSHYRYQYRTNVNQLFSLYIYLFCDFTYDITTTMH